MSNARSENVAMWNPDLQPCKRCGILRTARPHNRTEYCLSCATVRRIKVPYDDPDLELTGGHWAADAHGIQRWIAA